MGKDFVRTVLREHAERNMHNKPNLWPTIGGKLGSTAGAKSVRTGRRLMLSPLPLSLAGGLALVVVIIWAVLWSGQTSNRVLNTLEASTTEQSLADGSITSMHGKRVVRYRNSSVDNLTECNVESWEVLSGKSRMEQSCREPDGSEHFSFGASKGDIQISYNSSHNEFIIDPISEEDQRKYWPKSLDEVMQNVATVGGLLNSAGAREVYTVTLVGEDQVIGRATYVLELQIKSLASTMVAHKQKLWVDKQIFIPLKEQSWDKFGTLRWEFEYQSLELNPRLDDSLFDVTPPLGSFVVDKRKATPEEMEQSWSNIRDKFSTPLFELNNPEVPELRQPRKPYFLESHGIVSQALVEPKTRGDALWLLIMQGPPSTFTVTGMGAGKPVTDGSVQGRVYSHEGSYALEMDKDGTRVVLYLPSNRGANTYNLLIRYAKQLQVMKEK